MKIVEHSPYKVSLAQTFRQLDLYMGIDFWLISPKPHGNFEDRGLWSFRASGLRAHFGVFLPHFKSS